MALYDTLNDIAGELEPLLNALSAKADARSVADAAALTTAIDSLVTNATEANDDDLEAKLATDARAAQRLKSFTAQASQKTQQLAASEANVKRFVSLATHVGNLITAGGTGNVGGCVTALEAACTDLGIA